MRLNIFKSLTPKSFL